MENLQRDKKVLQQQKAQKTIVYVSTRAGVDYWDRILPSLLGVKVYPMHGDHKSEIRTKNLNRFTDATEPAAVGCSWDFSLLGTGTAKAEPQRVRRRAAV